MAPSPVSVQTAPPTASGSASGSLEKRLAASNDKHFITAQRMPQSVYDTRIFYNSTPDVFFIAHVHVDDTRITA